MSKRWELTFEGASGARYFPVYQRIHRTLASAETEARRVMEILETIHHPQAGAVTASHHPQIYGPGGEQTTVRWV